MAAVEPKQDYQVDLSPAVARAFNRLASDLGKERLIQLAELLAGVAENTGYGSVEVIVAAGRVVQLKEVRSHR